MIRTTTAAKRLSKQFPQIAGIRADGDSIFLGDCAEGGTIDDLPACQYYNEDYREVIYIMGVHKKLIEALEKLGFYPECNNPGSYTAYRM